MTDPGNKTGVMGIMQSIIIKVDASHHTATAVLLLFLPLNQALCTEHTQSISIQSIFYPTQIEHISVFTYSTGSSSSDSEPPIS